MWRIFPAIPVRMKIASELIEIESDPVRLMGQGGHFHGPRIECQAAHQSNFSAILQALKRRSSELGRTRVRFEREVRSKFPRLAEYRLSARVGVLNIEDRVV